MSLKGFVQSACFIATTVIFTSCNNHHINDNFADNAAKLWNHTLSCFKTSSDICHINLFYENYPNNEIKDTYLVDGDTLEHERVANLWVTSSAFSAANALYAATHDNEYLEWLEKVMIPIIECYRDTTHEPSGFQSYPIALGKSDRYYDDCERMGQEFLTLYEQTGNSHYLSKSESIWDFVQTGMDDTLEGGIYWSEANKFSKHVCTCAPAIILSLRLYQITANEKYLAFGEKLYHWTKKTLQDPVDGLYFDNIRLDNVIDPTKYPHNNGLMMQAATSLYLATKENTYLDDAQKIAKACSEQFFSTYREGDSDVLLLQNGNIWLVAVMLRGYEELYKIDKNDAYISVYKHTLNRLWAKGRDKDGFFCNGILSESIQFANSNKQLMTQCALVEMYARLSVLE